MSESELRAAFNASRVFERADAGEVSVLIDDSAPHPKYNQPAGAVSRTYTYFEVVDNRVTKLAVAHAFVLADGTINNEARRPDPKYLLKDGEIWALPRSLPPLPSKPPPPPRPG